MTDTTQALLARIAVLRGALSEIANIDTQHNTLASAVLVARDALTIDDAKLLARRHRS